MLERDSAIDAVRTLLARARAWWRLVRDRRRPTGQVGAAGAGGRAGTWVRGRHRPRRRGRSDAALRRRRTGARSAAIGDSFCSRRLEPVHDGVDRRAVDRCPTVELAAEELWESPCRRASVQDALLEV